MVENVDLGVAAYVKKAYLPDQVHSSIIEYENTSFVHIHLL